MWVRRIGSPEEEDGDLPVWDLQRVPSLSRSQFRCLQEWGKVGLWGGGNEIVHGNEHRDQPGTEGRGR